LVPGIEVVAAADTNRKAVERAQATYGIRNTYLDFEEMLEKERLDAVTVVASADSHALIVGKSLRKGLHVICEKPLTTEPKDSRRLTALAEARKRLLAVTFTYRFVPDTRRMKEVIESGCLGGVVEMRFLSLSGMFERYPAGSEERTKYDRIYTKVKGMVFDCGIHAFDLLCWYAGSPVKRVQARATCHLGYPYPDTCTAILEFENKIKAVYDYGKLPYYCPDIPSKTFFRVIITGTRGSMVWNFGCGGKKVKKSILQICTREGVREEVFPIYSKGRDYQYRQFAESIRRGRLSGFFPSPREASYATEVADLVVRSGMENVFPSVLRP